MDVDSAVVRIISAMLAGPECRTSRRWLEPYCRCVSVIARRHSTGGIGGAYPDFMKPVDVVIRSVDAKDFDGPQKLASIWVRSTALRDGSVEPTRVSSAVEGIRRRGELDGARALVPSVPATQLVSYCVPFKATYWKSSILPSILRCGGGGSQHACCTR
ncbi:hypothetical protein QM797_16660 [Rhodococcus sp. IEGM 1381]|uniref:hypothetical protein n=1 Tax=Rhodococcus sp. IEGM 1381 TaxID=3047085 RepID=UPI0024B7BC8F|nr:hypothetical protein [Rhodococcus sp. IEGM 1381]MDI9896359.1 hypothetical protein [Rhodococcus sp. IEGM 1381]